MTWHVDFTTPGFVHPDQPTDDNPPALEENP